MNEVLPGPVQFFPSILPGSDEIPKSLEFRSGYMNGRQFSRTVELSEPLCIPSVGFNGIA
ncbi:hypothetical protein R50912_15780 [Paenibacillus sp. FSL R5-0912]|nr:hypothetical protein R50912_15780 [Paenibacillus sp. FSL R5-0912]